MKPEPDFRRVMPGRLSLLYRNPAVLAESAGAGLFDRRLGNCFATRGARRRHDLGSCRLRTAAVAFMPPGFASRGPQENGQGY